MTLEQAVAILNQHEYLGRNNWYVGKEVNEDGKPHPIESTEPCTIAIERDYAMGVAEVILRDLDAMKVVKP